MQLEYLDGELRRLATDFAFNPEGWSSEEIQHFLLVAQCVQAATAERDLLNLRILRLRRSEGNPAASVPLGPRRRLMITFKATSDTSPIALLDLLRNGTDMTK